MRPFIIAATGLLGVHLSALCATGGEAPPSPKFAVHLQPHVTGKGVDVCAQSPTETMLPCSSFTTHGEVGTGYDLYIVIGQADSTGIGGATFGIDYDDTEGEGIAVIGEWLLCASGLQFPSTGWPDPGTGNVLTWNPQTGCATTVIAPDAVHATAGALYVFAYGEGRFSVTPHRKLASGPALKIADCNSAETPVSPDSAGYAAFGSGTGYNPCGGIIPTEPTTWGKLKTRY